MITNEDVKNSLFLSIQEECGTVARSQKVTPLDRVGVYVPGGKAALSLFCVDEMSCLPKVGGCW